MLLVDPDHILPGQLLDRYQWTPEHRLCAAVLEEAVSCFQKYVFATAKEQRRLFLDAEQWLRNNDRRWPFSFLRVCEVLSLNPAYVREGLARWRKQNERARAHPSTTLADTPTGAGLFRAAG